MNGEQIPERSCMLLVNSEADKIGHTPNKLQKILKQFYKKQSLQKESEKKKLEGHDEDVQSNDTHNSIPSLKLESINILSPSPEKRVNKEPEIQQKPKTPKKVRAKKPAVIKKTSNLQQKPITRKKPNRKTN